MSSAAQNKAMMGRKDQTTEGGARTINRRRFLAASGASLAAAGLAAAATPDSSRLDWASVRAEFALTPDYIHLSSFFLASHPRPVRAAIEQHRRAIEENPFLYVERNLFTMPGRVQAAAASYLGGKPEEVALTNSTTQGLAFVYHGLPVRAGQELLTTTHEHYVHHTALRLAAERAGATVKMIALYDNFNAISEAEIVARLRRAITPKTRVVGITWVHSSTGVKLPVRRIAAMLAEVNAGRDAADRALLVVDGVHGFGVEDEAVAQMGCDFFCAGTHKWLFGPRGTGLVWARAEHWKRLRPVFPLVDFASFAAWMGGTAAPGGMTAAGVAPGGFQAFEYAWALPAAFEFHQRIGRKRIAARIHALNEQCKEGLAGMRHVQLYTPRGSKLSAGIISFNVAGMKPEAVVERLLARRILASKAPYAFACARIAPSLLNSPAEIEITLREIRALAAHAQARTRKG